jgi:hypothetical protein
MFEAYTDELGQVARADPNREAAAVDRVRAIIADADAQKAHSVLIEYRLASASLNAFDTP